MIRLANLADMYDVAVDSNDEQAIQFYADTIIRAIRLTRPQSERQKEEKYKKEIIKWAEDMAARGVGSKAETIKRVRADKNWGFVEGKDWVEANIPRYHVDTQCR